MNCSSAESVFERVLDGKLTRPRRAAFDAHLAGCGNCRGVFEELRAVDALLTQPRRVDLGPDFTCATMAETLTLRAPAIYRTPVRAYLVSYVAAAWLIAGAALVFAPQMMQALAATLIEVARNVAEAVGGVGTVVARAFGRGGGVMLTALLGALVVLDAVLVAAFGLALKYARLGPAERQRP